MNTLTKLITELDLKFTSGNSVPVDSVRITHEEYSLLKYHALSHPLGVPSDLEFDEPQSLEELKENENVSIY